MNARGRFTIPHDCPNHALALFPSMLMFSIFSRAAAPACAALLLLAACEGPTASVTAATYRLATIDGVPLPAALTITEAPLPVFDVVSGSLVLHGDGTVTESWTLRCKDDLPEWVTCSGDGAWVRSGTHTDEPPVVRINDDQFLSTSTVAGRSRIILQTNERGGSAHAAFEYVR